MNLDAVILQDKELTKSLVVNIVRQTLKPHKQEMYEEQREHEESRR